MLTRRDFGKAVLATVPAAGLAARASAFDKVNSTIRGVRMGLQSACFTFSGLGLDDIVKTMRAVGLADIDVMSEHVEQYLGAPGIQLPGTGRPGPWARDTRAGGAGAAASASGVQASDGSVGRRAGAPGGFGRGADPAAREALRKWRLDIGLDRYREVGKKFTDAGLKLYSYNLSFNDSYTD